MFKGLANLASMMRQAQKMGSKMKEMGERLKGMRAVGTSGGGMVEVEVNGLGEILRLTLDPSLTDREMIEVLVPSAVNQAQSKAKALHSEAMQSLAEGFNVPEIRDAIDELKRAADDEDEFEEDEFDDEFDDEDLDEDDDDLEEFDEHMDRLEAKRKDEDVTPPF